MVKFLKSKVTAYILHIELESLESEVQDLQRFVGIRVLNGNLDPKLLAIFTYRLSKVAVLKAPS